MTSPLTSLGFTPGQNLNLSRFTDSEIQAAESLVSQYLLDTFPTMDFAKGSTLYDIVVRPTAAIYLISRLEWESLKATQSLRGVISNPELASDDVVNAILSNFQITRKAGSAAAGYARMVFSRGVSQAIQSSLIFRTQDGLEFKPAGAFRLIDSVVEETDIQLVANGVSQYVAIVPLRAVMHGAKYQISDGTPFTVNVQSSAFVSAAAFGNFSGGSDDETNADLINRLPEAMATKNLASRLSVSATIKDRFPNIVDVSTQGAFDPAMTRNAHNVLNVKVGGFADIYVKALSGVSVRSLSLNASRISLDTEAKNATYLAAIGRDMVPGIYFARSVRTDVSSISGFLITDQVRGLDMSPLSGGRPTNLVPLVVEGAFSRYQTLDVIFVVDYDESTGQTIEDQLAETMPVIVDAVFTEQIEQIQDMVSDRESGIILADYLVKAAIPCFVHLPLIRVKAQSYDVATDIRLEIYNYINKLRMGAPLSIDEMVVRIRSVPGVSGVALPLFATGEILCPSGDILDVRSDGDLEIPYKPHLGVVPQNTTFLVELAEIDIEVIVT
jgi:hypothetical protein